MLNFKYILSVVVALAAAVAVSVAKMEVGWPLASCWGLAFAIVAIACGTVLFRLLGRVMHTWAARPVSGLMSAIVVAFGSILVSGLLVFITLHGEPFDDVLGIMALWYTVVVAIPLGIIFGAGLGQPIHRLQPPSPGEQET